MKINANEIKVGMLIEYKNDLWEVLKTQHVKPGKGGAFNQVEMKSVNNGSKHNERFRSSENVEKALVEQENFSFLYGDNDNFYFMNSKNFEQINLNKNIVAEKGIFLKENMEVKISFYEEKPISLELPINAEYEVKETEGALKGQTVSSSYKPAELENKIKIQVPPFIEVGDKIILDTRNCEYVKKI